MAKRVLTLSMAVGLGSLLVASAAAAPPVHEPQPPIPTVTYLPGTPTEVCPFPLTVEATRLDGRLTTFFDRNGDVTRQQGSGSLVLRITNESPGGGSIELNSGGPGVTTLGPSGELVFQAHGLWTILLFPGDVGPGGVPGPGAIYVRGHMTFTVAPTGQLTVGEVHGTVQDICGLVE